MLQRRQEEELSAFRARLEDFQLTEPVIQSGLARIRRAFERGESELMIASFPSSFCSDAGRAINNAGIPPINRGDAESGRASEPEWLATTPKGVRLVYEYWKANLKPCGFKLTARIIDFPGGKPGNVGLFLSWPKSTMDEA